MSRILEEATRRLRNYEGEIKQLRQKFTVKEKAKETLEINIAKLRFAREIWPRVSAEIWRNIFAMVCVANPRYHYGINFLNRSIKPTLVMPPVTLSHVCPQWRTIVLGSPELWTNIDIVLGRLPQGAIHLIRIVLERSKGQPMDIGLSLGALALPDHADGVWEALLESSSHWKALTLYEHNLTKLLEIQVPNIPDVPFPNLVSFTCCAAPELIDEENWLWDALQEAPRLRTVEITLLYPTFSLPYTQLTTLRLRPCSKGDSKNVEGLFEVLSLCKNLCRLTLEINYWDGVVLEESGGFPNVKLPCLHYLKIENQRGVQSNYFLDVVINSLHMPFLDSFDLQCSSQSIISWPDPLRSLLKRCSLLRRLSLHFTDFGDPEFRADGPLSDILQAAPNLTCLELRTYGSLPFTERNFQANELLFSFLTELKDPHGRRFLLPKLESLSIVRDGEAFFYDFILANLLAIAKCRRKQGAFSLKTVKLQRYFQRPELVYTVGSNVMEEEISALKRQGVYVLLEDLTGLKESSFEMPIF